MPQALPAIGAIASVVGTVGSLYFQNKAAKEQEKQQKLSTRRSRRQAIREMQLTRARSLVSAQGAGSLTSSGAMGGIGALSSQVGSELGFQSAYNAMSSNISSYGRSAELFSGIASIGGTIFNLSGEFGKKEEAVAPAPRDYTRGFTTPIAPNRPPTLAPSPYNPTVRPYGAI